MAPWRSRVAAAGLAVALCGAALAGCSGDDVEGGMALPSQRGGVTFAGARGPVTGTVALQRNGCFRLDTGAGTRLVVWPRGAEQDPDDGAVIRLASGRRLHHGDRVAGTGLEYPATGLPASTDGYWNSVLTFCAPGEATVLVLDDVRPV